MWPNGFELGVIAQNPSAYRELMLSSGMTWVRQSVGHGQNAQHLIADAHDLGLRILLTATGDKSRAHESDYQDEFAAFVAQLAEQGADAIEIWNEPNINPEMAVTDPVSYTSLLCKAYAAIKSASLSTLVISGAPAPTGYYGGCTKTGCDDLPWLQGLYDAGAAECTDLVGAHYAAGATGPAASSGHPWQHPV